MNNSLLYTYKHNAVLLISILLWLFVACQSTENRQSELDVLTPTYSDTVTPAKTVIPKLEITPKPTALSITASPPRSTAPIVTHIIEPKETASPTTVSTLSSTSCDGTLAFLSQRYDTNEDMIIDFDDNVHIYSQEIGGRATQLTTGSHRNIDPSWSPDGERIAFVSNRSGNFELFIMNANGSDLRQITTTIDKETTPAWSPDGSSIAYVLVENLDSGMQKRSLYLISPEGGSTEELPTGTGNIFHPNWSPDGRFLIFERQDIVENQGGAVREINIYFWDMLTDSLIPLQLKDGIFQDITLRNPKWLSHDGYFLSFFIQKIQSDVPTSEVKVYEMEWVDGMPVLGERFTITSTSDPYVWGENGESFMSLIYNSSTGKYDLECILIDYLAEPPIIDLYDSSLNREFLIDNVFYYSDPVWIP